VSCCVTWLTNYPKLLAGFDCEVACKRRDVYCCARCCRISHLPIDCCRILVYILVLLCYQLLSPLRNDGITGYRVGDGCIGSDGGISQKASDYSCVPLCRNCHTGGRYTYHRVGKVEFERRYGVDFTLLVRALNIAHKAECDANAGGELWQR
jgi:hypothetical protein